MKRSLKLVAVFAVALATAATPAGAAPAASVSAVAGTGTQDPLPLGLTAEIVERHINFTATGAFAVAPNVSDAVQWDCFLDSTSSETALSGSGVGLLFCEEPGGNGDALFVNRAAGVFTRVGAQVVYQSSHAGLWVGDATATSELVLTFSIVPTDLLTTAFAMAGSMAVANAD